MGSSGCALAGQVLGLLTLTVPATVVLALSEGWGLRVSPDGRTGVITRSGEALQVVRGDGSTIVVTVDDAQHAAGLLNRLADEGQ